MKSEIHDCPVVIARNNFKFKSLSCWAVNGFLGCGHGCRVCFVTDTSANKQMPILASYDKAQSNVWSHPSGRSYPDWLEFCWNRISEWPGKPGD